MINISGLTFDYPGHRALSNINLTVTRGSVTAVVGPNGSGKTTLMRCIAGLEIPLEGSILVDGMDVIERPREVHRRMGYLSDFFGLYQELTVAQCLEYAAASQGLPEIEIQKAIERTAQQLQISDRLQQKSASLSRGLRQRVAIAQAIIHNPKVLLLDEPASGLDPEARSHLAALFRQLQSSGMTILVSSHILAELDEYSTHILSLRSGQVMDSRVLLSNQSDSIRSLQLKLLSADARLESWLREQSGIVNLNMSPDFVQFEFSGDLKAQAALLADLLKSGFVVASFAEYKENLQQTYMRSVNAHLDKTQ